MRDYYEIMQFNPCKESVKFRKNYPDFQSAWADCHRGDWMLWIAKRLNVDLLKLTTAKALCANTVRHLMKDERNINTIDVAIKFGKGEASIEELNNAAYDAYLTTYTTNDIALSLAHCANGCVNTVISSDVAVYSAKAYFKLEDKKKNQQETANICREILTEDVLKAINKL